MKIFSLLEKLIKFLAMNDDFNTPILIAHLFDAVRIVNTANDNKLSLTQSDIDLLKTIYQNHSFLFLADHRNEGCLF